MYNEFYRHKKSDAAKWVIVFLLIILLAAGVASSLFIGIKNMKNAEEEKVPEVTEEKITETAGISEPTFLTLSMGQARIMSLSEETETGSETEGNYVSQTVSAVITPSTVVDKYVTWSLAWDTAAALKDSDISEYLRLSDDSQGNITATVNCYKSFRGSKAILTCTTRQGNVSASVDVVYEGVPSEMVIPSPSGVTQYNLGKDSVDLLYVGSIYSTTFTLDNIFHDVGTSYNDYTVTVSGAGTVNCGVYSESPRGAGWTSTGNTVDFSSIANEFISYTVTARTIRINVIKSLYDYYESKETTTVEGNGETTTYTNKLYALNTDSEGNLPYFIVTVRHNTLKFSAQYKFFISEEVSGVSTNTTSVAF